MAFRMLTPAQRWFCASWMLALPLAADDSPIYGQLAAGKGEVGDVVSPAPTDGVVHYGWRGAKVGRAPIIPSLFDRPVPLFPPLFQHGDPEHPGRHVGLGQPLVGTSWMNRPFHAGWLVGGMFGDELIEGQVDQDEDIFGGYRLGWDFDHYWGSELRFAFAFLDLTYAQAPAVRRTSRDYFWDINLLYYPWGDARWRPYFSLGLGVADFKFLTAAQQSVRQTVVALPLGFGVKYRWKKWLAVRADLTDNLSFGARGINTMHNVSLTLGAEIQLGGRRKSYFPF